MLVVTINYISVFLLILAAVYFSCLLVTGESNCQLEGESGETMTIQTRQEMRFILPHVDQSPETKRTTPQPVGPRAHNTPVVRFCGTKKPNY